MVCDNGWAGPGRGEAGLYGEHPVPRVAGGGPLHPTAPPAPPSARLCRHRDSATSPLLTASALRACFTITRLPITGSNFLLKRKGPYSFQPLM